MRRAKALGHWKNVLASSPKTQLTALVVGNLSGLGTGTLDFSKGVTVLCGANGSGKSSILELVAACLAPGLPEAAHRFSSGTVELALDWRGKSHRITLDLSGGPREIASEIAADLASDFALRWIDTGAQVPRLQAALRKLGTDPAEGLDPIDLKVGEIKALSYAVGKRYDEIELYELDDLPGWDAAPFVKVKSADVVYTAAHMGTGELAVFYLLWELRRSVEGELILIEEPESFLAPSSQSAVMDLVAFYLESKKVSAVVTTHSPTVASVVPPENARILAPMSAQSPFVKADDTGLHLQLLGLSPGIDTIMFVEDSAAADLLKCVLRKHAPSLLERVEILWCGSDEKVISCANAIPNFTRRLGVIACVDGDMASKEYKCEWPVLVLPGGVAADQFLRDAALANPKGMAEKLGTSTDIVTVKMAALHGADHHDWTTELARNLGSIRELVATLMFQLWCVDGKIEEVAAFSTLLLKATDLGD